MVVVTISVALGQSTTTPSLAFAASSDRSALPDSPLLTAVQIQPQQQAPYITQWQSSSSSPQPAVLAYANPNSQVTVLEDTLIRVITNQPLNSRQSKDGTAVLFALSVDVIVNTVIVIPRGVTVHGELVQARKAGALTGSSELTLKLVSLDLGGRVIHSSPISSRFKGRAIRNRPRPKSREVQ